MKTTLRRFLAAACAAAGTFALASPALAEYPEDDIRIIVPYGPGGGFDTIARIIADALPQYLPDGATVIVENVSGAGGRRGVGEIYRADPDGYTIGVVATTMILAEVSGEDLPFKLGEMTQFGRLSYDGMAVVAAPDSEFQSIEDLRNADRPVLIAASQKFTPGIVASLLDFPFEVVTGYAGAGEFVSAVVRGDVDLSINTPNGFVSYAEGGQLSVLAIFDPAYEEAFPDAVTVEDMGIPDLANVITGRFMMGPPGIPDEARDTLAEALAKVAEDPEVLERARQANAAFDYAPPAEVEGLLADQYRLTEEYSEFLE
ncbi:tripartite tricarboxylate transporter substrate binding protein [Oceanicola sp. D3]|uniref:Bug family tripartite tricarboxylate transporter substrate binding protein n=1 Tax=Oceanicola sp. D3 TaxID=2587163 RepID=UPI001124698C|nr:tripartite tricarboxylate transporter substrate binding protein [Oceanicola sp. D3]QDC08608.1 tripartite tricarboxylate transporter substrate binding protein [Oceanicola sp. D3]